MGKRGKEETRGKDTEMSRVRDEDGDRKEKDSEKGKRIKDRGFGVEMEGNGGE